MSTIPEFYSDQTVFLTGATGFLGKLVIEKIFRTCPDVKKLYLLVRARGTKSVDDRIKEMFSAASFDQVKALQPDFRNKIGFLNGDCSQPVLGLSPEAQEILKNEANCVIHCAANVRFDVDLKTAVLTNVRSVRDLLDLAKDLKHLKSFVYVSTGFSHCHSSTIREEFYDVNLDPEKLLQLVENLDEKTLKAITPHLIEKWPNTYVYTKAIAEEVIRKYKQEIPVAIVRPTIVLSSLEEPIPGWIDNFHGVVGVLLGVCLGVVRSLHLGEDNPANLIPADYVVSVILASAWDIEQSRLLDKKHTIPIYNCSPCKDNIQTWGWFEKNMKKFTFKYPLSDAVWYHYIQTTPYKTVHNIRVFFYHTVFAYMVDALLFLLGKRTLAVEKYKKINKLIGLVSYFLTNTWHFEIDNTLKLYERLYEGDKKVFKFNVNELDWKEYMEIAIVGGRVHLMKDPLDTLPKARRKMILLRIIHYVFIGLLFYFWYWLLTPVFKLFM